LRREPLVILDDFSVVEPFLGVAVCFLEALLFQELDEFSLGVRCDDDVEVRGEACVERGDSVAADKDVLVPRLRELLEQFDECVTPVGQLPHPTSLTLTGSFVEGEACP